MSRASTILGLLLGVIILSLSMVDFSQGKIISAFFNWQGLMIVLGGTLAAILINYPFKQVGCVFKSFYTVVSTEEASIEESIEQVIYLNNIARKEGVLALEKEAALVDDTFLRSGLLNLMIYKEGMQMKLALINSLNSKRTRDLMCQDVFNNMASYAPAFGMMGTVMGLIMMMTTQVSGVDTGPVGEGKDMLDVLLQGMGLALVTTFYGVLFANFLFIPIAGKLKVLSDAEVLKNEILIEGLLGIQRKENSLLLRETLFAYVNEQTQHNLERRLR